MMKTKQTNLKRFSKNIIFIGTFAHLLSCSSSEEQQQSSLRRENQKGEFIYRKGDEFFYSLKEPVAQPPPTYPWEESARKGLKAITKEYFRCKGSILNPERLVEENGEIKSYSDCSGSDRHGLQMRDGKEFVYPILLNVLNHIQRETEKRVIITSGHRCPEHNSYVDSSKDNRYSKHMIGAEVSFYVQGLENDPNRVIDAIRNYYIDDEPQYSQFRQYPKNCNTRAQPWYNKEIFVKLYEKDEGRNLDNRHPYPYISIQVRYDRETEKTVTYSWSDANKNYLRK